MFDTSVVADCSTEDSGFGRIKYTEMAPPLSCGVDISVVRSN